jgi:hypothetical protein
MYDETMMLNEKQYRKLTTDSVDIYKEAYELKLQFPEGYLVEHRPEDKRNEYVLKFKTKKEFDDFYTLFHETSLSLSK